MRKDCREVKSITIAQVDSYHRRNTEERENNLDYSVCGFGEARYYTSDRYERLIRDEQNPSFLRRPNGKPMLGFGIEVETECWGIKREDVLAELLTKVIFSHFPEGLWKLQSDASLLGGDSSAECISQVMTKEFIRNHYKDFKLMYSVYFPSFGISASRSGNCGMHTNVSLGNFGKTPEAQAEAVRKLGYILSKHYDFCAALLRRNVGTTPQEREDLTYYCHQMSTDKAWWQNLDLQNNLSDHGVCFNLGHYNEGRVEIRLIGGQMDYPSFRNTMECIFHLVSRVCKLSWSDCDKLEVIFRGCNQYVFDRLRSYCKDAGTVTDEQLAAIRETIVRADYI